MKELYLKKLNDNCTEDELAKLVKLSESTKAKKYLNSKWLILKGFLAI